ncbi:hypothetical protein [Komagataeibacter nataicola]|uniref:hypothetical protein n=1 Tax=Komagataeibacter nataicola TaxID=265960 RepID=UPI0011B4ECE8|nr:hypothetical protein [Komagataeibacter nataicola]WNM10324.1 hypothetical protein RI056_18665 [Komagataeibacter nataicola]GBR23321.1 hypothetical protein AA0616_2491 [Komagataeibacter nataicola NRIC 0616]
MNNITSPETGTNSFIKVLGSVSSLTSHQIDDMLDTVEHEGVESCERAREKAIAELKRVESDKILIMHAVSIIRNFARDNADKSLPRLIEALRDGLNKTTPVVTKEPELVQTPVDEPLESPSFDDVPRLEDTVPDRKLENDTITVHPEPVSETIAEPEPKPEHQETNYQVREWNEDETSGHNDISSHLFTP